MLPPNGKRLVCPHDHATVTERDTIFAKRAECQAKAKHYEKMHGERQIFMKIRVDKDTITNP